MSISADDVNDPWPEINFTVPGLVQGKQRPRRAGNIKGTYTPAKTVNYETYIKELFAVKYPDFVPIDGAVQMALLAYYPIPKSKSKYVKQEMASGARAPTVRPDIDNIIKIVMDALQGLAFMNDTQVVSVRGIKRYGDQPRLEISVSSEFLR